ncbi:hypothetical protein NLJ89_g1414 [Agrocybe chaxingu]|uniref:DUF6535 domain-containing protein n=1 Tax=Agrocybe chaxingu TaxID=84603 RepID=A0A9W8TFA1_9AGAR|nr:hypothetical protein NLJ89_g1414 [Agrocybe chaxingu]
MPKNEALPPELGDGEPVSSEPEVKTPKTTQPPLFKCGTPYRYMPPRKEGTDYWEKILEPVQKKDRAQCDAWRDEVQFILIFSILTHIFWDVTKAGLFSAVVTAFLVESYKNLQPDPTEATVILLARIAERLDNPLNGSTTSLDPSSNPFSFTPEFSSIRVNIFWFLSLVLSLTTVLIGIVSLQWLREHQSYPEYFSTEDTFMLLHMRTEMLEKWHVSAFFALLPFLLQVALVLFFIGLADFLASLGVWTVTIPVILLITGPIFFLVATTAIPTLQCYSVASPRTQMDSDVPVPCPYKSPQAQLFRWVFSASPGAQILRYGLLPAYSAFIQSFKYIRRLWNQNGAQDKLQPCISTDFVAAPKWADLDLEWISEGYIKTGHSAHFMIMFKEFYESVCFALTIPSYQATPEATPSLAPSAFKRQIADHELRPSYKSLIKMLKQDSLPVISDVLASPGVELLYDEVLLLFLQRLGSLWRNYRMELYFRVRDYFYIYHAVASRKVDEVFSPFYFNIEWCESIGYHRHARYFTEMERRYLDKRDAEYMDSFIKEIAKGKLDWSAYQLFDYYGVRRLISQYVRNSPPSHAPLLSAAKSLRSALWQYLNLDTASEPQVELKAIQSFLISSALVFVDVYLSKRVTTPQEIINLGVVLQQFCERALSNKLFRDRILKLNILDRIPVPMEWPRSPASLDVTGLSGEEKKIVRLLEVVRAHTSDKFPERLFRENVNSNENEASEFPDRREVAPAQEQLAQIGAHHIQQLLRDIPGGIQEALGAAAAHNLGDDQFRNRPPESTQGGPIRSLLVVNTTTPPQPRSPLPPSNDLRTRDTEREEKQIAEENNDEATQSRSSVTAGSTGPRETNDVQAGENQNPDFHNPEADNLV